MVFILSILKDMKPIHRLLIYLVIITSVIVISAQSEDWRVPLAGYLLLILFVFLFQRLDNERFNWGKNFIKGFLVGLFAISGIFLIELFSGLISIERSSSPINEIIIGGLIVQLIVAFGEELSFRAYILSRLSKYGIWRAIITSSFFFSTLHIPALIKNNLAIETLIVMLTTIFFIQTLLSIFYFSDGLKLTLGFHFSWNFFQYHIFSLGNGFAGIMVVHSSDVIMTGGANGPEAGLIGLIFFSIAVGITLYLIRE